MIETLYRAIEGYRPLCPQEEADRAEMLRCIERFPGDVLTRENRLAHFTASVWVTTPGREQALMVWHNIYRSWSWIGVHADGESDLLAVAMRELEEETGLTAFRPVTEEIWSLETLCVPAHVKRGAFVSPHLHLNLTYLMEADAAAPLRAKPDENSGVAWFPAGSAAARSTEKEMRVIYEKLLARLR